MYILKDNDNELITYDDDECAAAGPSVNKSQNVVNVELTGR